MRKNVTVIESKRFDWHSDTRQFMAEASELRGVNLFCRCFDDAFDVGFDMVSSHTGKVRRFYLSRTETDRNGDFAAWYFRDEKNDTELVLFNT